jgi:carbon-monoxide dehydrogenase medium subunit
VIPARFDYQRAATLDDALRALAARDGTTRAIAGGQSLLPLMKLRLARPDRLVDVGRLEELRGVRRLADGRLAIGALTTWSQLLVDAAVMAVGVLGDAIPTIGDVAVRNRGTLGGSLAHADPAAELPVWAVARGARLKLSSRQGERWVEAADFYVGLMTTALEPHEMVTEIEVPEMPAGSGWAFEEFARRHGDYALMGVAARITVDGDVCREARLVYMAAGETPTPAPEACRLLESEGLADAAIDRAAALAAEREIEPSPDIHAGVSFKRHLAAVLTRRALRRARDRAGAARAA